MSVLGGRSWPGERGSVAVARWIKPYAASVSDSITFPAGRSPAAYRKWLILRIVLSVGLLGAAAGAALAMLVVEDGARGGRGLLGFAIILAIAGFTVLASTSQETWRRRNGQEVRGPTRRGLVVDRSGFADATNRRRGRVPWHHVARWWVEGDELRVELRYGKPRQVIRLSGLRAPQDEISGAFEKYSKMPPSR